MLFVRGGPFTGGVYKFRIQFPDEFSSPRVSLLLSHDQCIHSYPNSSPSVYFLTPVYHPLITNPSKPHQLPQLNVSHVHARYALEYMNIFEAILLFIRSVFTCYRQAVEDKQNDIVNQQAHKEFQKSGEQDENIARCVQRSRASRMVKPDDSYRLSLAAPGSLSPPPQNPHHVYSLSAFALFVTARYTHSDSAQATHYEAVWPKYIVVVIIECPSNGRSSAAPVCGLAQTDNRRHSKE